MIKPENKSTWAGSIDDLGRALARLLDSETMAADALCKYPSLASNLLQTVHAHSKDPNIFTGALTALTMLFKKADHENHPENLAALAALAVPRDGVRSIALPLISIVRQCADHMSGKKGSNDFGPDVAKEALELINQIINTAGYKGLGWLGTSLLETENMASQQLFTEAIKRAYCALDALK